MEISYLQGWDNEGNYASYAVKDFNNFSILQIWSTEPYILDSFEDMLKFLLKETSCNHIRIFLHSKKHSKPLDIKKMELMFPDSLEYMINENKNSIKFGYGCLGRIESASTFEREAIKLIKELYPYFIVLNISRIELYWKINLLDLNQKRIYQLLISNLVFDFYRVQSKWDELSQLSYIYLFLFHHH